MSNVENVDIFNNLLLNLLKQNEKNYNNNTVVKNKYGFNILKYIILNNIKYKRVSGVRLEAAGRLTKRYTASRSRYKVIYKGNLENTLFFC